MAVLPIRMYPDPVLREPGAPVGEIDEWVRKLVADMAETMLHAEGIGLAAPQVGVQRRVLVYRTDVDEPEEQLHALVDPEIAESSGEVVADEGCLSIPGLAFPVARAQRIVIRATGMDGQPKRYEAVDLEARVLQHEVDHLDGILFLERLTPEFRREAMSIIRERALQPAAASARVDLATRI